MDSNDDIEAGTITNSMIEITLPIDGTYEIEVRSFDNLSGGEYTLIIESDRANAGATPKPSD